MMSTYPGPDHVPKILKQTFPFAYTAYIRVIGMIGVYMFSLKIQINRMVLTIRIKTNRSTSSCQKLHLLKVLCEKLHHRIIEELTFGGLIG